MKKPIFLANALGHAVIDKRIEILRLIGKSGSISQAAREAKVSYKAAWQAIDTLTNLAGVNLVEKVVGGVGGGGARLSEAGVQLLTAADLVEKVRHEVLSQLLAGHTDVSSSTLAQLSIRTSMRNHLPCQVQDIQHAGQIVRLALRLPGSEILVASITRASAELLALTTGQAVVALFKATAVKVGAPSNFRKKPGRNLLSGQVGRISRGETGDEITVTLGAGLQLVGFAPAGQSFKRNAAVVAALDESAVVVALAE